MFAALRAFFELVTLIFKAATAKKTKSEVIQLKANSLKNQMQRIRRRFKDRKHDAKTASELRDTITVIQLSELQRRNKRPDNTD
jgi:hypothetical protein